MTAAVRRPSPAAFHVVHATGGRVRLRVPGLGSDPGLQQLLAHRLRECKQVRRFRINPGCDSLVIEHRGTAPDVAALVRRRAASDASAPASPPARDEEPQGALAWATLAEQALSDGATDDVTGYAYARVGYHRSLDLLRRNGWKGHGPVPWEHEPNRGFLRSLNALARAAAALGEEEEAQRCEGFLRDSSPTATAELTGG